MSYIICILSILLYSLYCTGNFNPYQVYEITAFNHRERSLLYTVQRKTNELIFLNGITNEAAIPMKVIAKNIYSQDFEEFLQSNSIEFIHINVTPIFIKTTIKEEMIHDYRNKTFIDIANKFLNWQEFNDWTHLKIQMNPHLSKIVIGTTYEDREIVVLKVSTGKRNSGVVIAGGEEGRDWMSPAIILNILNGILEDKYNLSILAKYYDLYFLPYFNPDGYEYSFYKDILWAKNRKAFFPSRKCTLDRLAVGVNIDRNWYLSKYDSGEQECNAVYIGNAAFSEEESKVVSAYLNNISINLMAYINLRGYERLITVPHKITNIQNNNHQILMDILSSTCNKLKANYNATYYYGSTSSIFYNFTGNSADWIKSNLNVPIVYTVYLKYQDYLLPNASHIQPLMQNFMTIIQDTLIFGYNIYGPLFNSQISMCVCFRTVTIILILVIVNI